jgi:hypothetical protein
MDCRDRSTLNDPCKRLALRIVELRRLARRFAVNQTIRPVGIETHYPVSDYLKPDIADPCRIPAPTTIVNLGQRQKPAALTRIFRPLGQSPQRHSIEIFP